VKVPAFFAPKPEPVPRPVERSCVTCSLVQTKRRTRARFHYTCGKTGADAYAERRATGDCGPDGKNWTAK